MAITDLTVVELGETYVGGKIDGRGKYCQKKTAAFGMLEREDSVMTLIFPVSRRAALLLIFNVNVAEGVGKFDRRASRLQRPR